MERVFLSTGDRSIGSNRGTSGGSGRVGGGPEGTNAGRRVPCGAHVVRGGGVDLATFENLKVFAQNVWRWFSISFASNLIFL